MPLTSAYTIPDETLTVGGLSAYIQDLLEQDPHLMQVWVLGEVSSAKQRSGHLFFTLKDPEGADQINCVTWRSQRPKLIEDPAPGEQVVVLGQMRVYPQRSTYQLNVVQLLPAGEGLQALQRRQLQARLAAEGLFDPALKQDLPPYPQILAVVTSPQAAAWGDIQRTLLQRHPGLNVLLAPAIVQGPQAPAAIADALVQVAQDGRAEVVILARGGGAREDLECFDHEAVVRAIALCPIPVITGVGHQRDESLADLVADYAAHTPTAAAEVAVLALAELLDQHQARSQVLIETLLDVLATRQQGLTTTARRLQRLRLDYQLEQEQQRLQWLQQRWVKGLQYRLQTAQNHCAALGQTLASLDPEAVLRRGYALVRDQKGDLLTHTDGVVPGDPLQIQVAVGALEATVTRVSPVLNADESDD
ncbi:MAG: exodeoxyribonuclease VII large subunit [Leptolyngbyaceae cyanobacterium]